MTYQFKPIHSIGDSTWDQFVLEKKGSPYQTHFWINLYKSAGFRDQSFGIFRDNTLVGVFPLVTLPIGPLRAGYSLPLASSGPLGELAPRHILFQHLKTLCDSIQFKTLQEISGDIALMPVKGIITDLTKTENELLADLSQTLRREIRKASSNPSLKLVDATTSQHIDEAWQLYEMTMARLDSGGSYWRSLFDGIFALPADMRKISLAYLDTAPIALNIFVRYGDCCHYFAAASNAEHHGSFANQFLQWENILWAKSKGSKILQLGGGLSFDGSDSLYRYKSKWGTPCFTYAGDFGLTWKGEFGRWLNAHVGGSIRRQLKRFVLND